MKVRLIVPKAEYEDDDGETIRRVNPVDAYGKAIADIAGGFTATQGTGGWIDGNGSLVVEPVTMFDIAASIERFRMIAQANEFRKLAKRIAVELHQDCVYLEIDGRVEFVKP